MEINHLPGEVVCRTHERGQAGDVHIEMLTGSVVAQLEAQRLTYVRDDEPLAARTGYRHFSRSRHLPAGRDFDDASSALMTWQVQARSGLRVAASSSRVELDAVVLMRIGSGRLSLSVPCRVVTVIDEPGRTGFAYGTLPGHPESGEEEFVLDHLPDGSVRLTISAVSRPTSLLARVGGPVTTLAQRVMTTRYLRALD